MNILNRIVSILGLSLSLFLVACGGSSDSSDGAVVTSLTDGPLNVLLDQFIDPFSSINPFANESSGGEYNSIGKTSDSTADNETIKAKYVGKFNYFVFLGANRGDVLFLQGIKQPDQWNEAQKNAAINSDEEFLVPKVVAEDILEGILINGEKFKMFRHHLSSYGVNNNLIDGVAAIGKKSTRELVKAIVGSDLAHLTQYPQAGYYRIVRVYVHDDPPYENTNPRGTVFKTSAKAAFDQAETDYADILPTTYGAYIEYLPYPKPDDDSPKRKIADFYYQQIKDAKVAPEALINGKFVAPAVAISKEECRSYSNSQDYCGYQPLFYPDPANFEMLAKELENTYCEDSAYSTPAGDKQYLLYWLCKQQAPPGWVPN